MPRRYPTVLMLLAGLILYAVDAYAGPKTRQPKMPTEQQFLQRQLHTLRPARLRCRYIEGYGYSSLNGATLLEPYFIDISRSQDMTAQLDVETSTRIGGQLEYRLVNGEKDHISVTGSFFNESIRSEQNRLERPDVDPQIADPTIPINRWGFVGLMQEYLTPSLFAYGSLAYGSDSLIFQRNPQCRLIA